MIFQKTIDRLDNLFRTSHTERVEEEINQLSTRQVNITHNIRALTERKEEMEGLLSPVRLKKHNPEVEASIKQLDVQNISFKERIEAQELELANTEYLLQEKRTNLTLLTAIEYNTKLLDEKR